MDNLKMRRLLAFAGIAIITAGMIGIVYGIFNNRTDIQLLGLTLVVIAYLLSVKVKRMRKAYEAEANMTQANGTEDNQ
jgi:fucose permease